MSRFDAEWARNTREGLKVSLACKLQTYEFCLGYDAAIRDVLAHHEQVQPTSYTIDKQSSLEAMKDILPKTASKQPDKLADMIFMRGTRWEDDVDTLIFREIHRRIVELEKLND